MCDVCLGLGLAGDFLGCDHVSTAGLASVYYIATLVDYLLHSRTCVRVCIDVSQHYSYVPSVGWVPGIHSYMICMYRAIQMGCI